MDNMIRAVIVHYDEIGLKGQNRRLFENQLVRNIKRALRGCGYETVRRLPGRLLVELTPESDVPQIREKLTRVFGIAYFGLAIESEQDIEALKQNALRLVQAYDQPYETIKVDTKRSNKEYPIQSPQVNATVGAHLLRHIQAGVDLSHPDLTCHIEIVNRTAFLYLGRVRGAGGLPVGVSGRVVTMLSGGIDSPVAAWQMMRRGCKTDFVHFYSYPYTDKASLEKVIRLTEHLTQYQYYSRLHLVPFADAQLQIVTKAPAKLRVVLYRRMMLRIAQALAERNHCEAIVTGESLAQVASQTLQNLRTIESVVTMPVLRPLIGMDKNDIVQRAKHIGTFEISTLPYDDCCSLFVPEHPATAATLEEAEAAEQGLDIPQLITQALEQTDVQEFEA